MTSRFVAVGCALLLGVGVGGTAVASPVAHPNVVSADPADNTPRVVTGNAVEKVLEVGGTTFAGGDFTQVQDSSRSTTYDRRHLFSFTTTTGALTALSVSFDGPVRALASDGASLWVGGDFKIVNGVTRRGLVKLNAVTGQVDPAFNARLGANVSDVQLVNARLLVAGKFAKRLQAVTPATGADTGYLNLGISGTVASNAGPTDVLRFAVNPARTKLVAIGNFTTVSGQSRSRAFMVELGATSGDLASWYYAPLARPCRATGIPAQLRDVDFSPDGSFFVMVASGYLPLRGDQGITVCDAAARFETNVANPFRPTWFNYTGGDTLLAVAVTNAAVYVQGHQRWVGSSGIGCTPGCSERAGIAALAPSDGKALPWNPGKDRGIGGKDLLLTTAGLWVPSDTTRIGGEIHERIAFFPLQ